MRIDFQNFWLQVYIIKIKFILILIFRNKESVGLNDIKRIFEEYLDEAYIGDNDILEYIKEFDKD